MKILIDECLPKALSKLLRPHVVKTATQMGWSGVTNGQLLRRAREAKFEALITVDKNIYSQRDVKGSGIAIVVLRPYSNRIPDVAPFAPKILALLAAGAEQKVHLLNR